jgi:hypothetical protein
MDHGRVGKDVTDDFVAVDNFIDLGPLEMSGILIVDNLGSEVGFPG